MTNQDPSLASDNQKIIEKPKFRKAAASDIIILLFVGIIAIGYLIPPSSLVGWFTLPIIFLGAAAGISFLGHCATATKGSPWYVQLLAIFSGLIIGCIIFIAGVVAAFMVGARDPNLRGS